MTSPHTPPYHPQNVNEARLQSLLNALSKSDIQIKSLHFHADVDWNNQEKLVLEFSYALHQGKFRRLEVSVPL